MDYYSLQVRIKGGPVIDLNNLKSFYIPVFNYTCNKRKKV